MLMGRGEEGGKGDERGFWELDVAETKTRIASEEHKAVFILTQ